MSTEMAPNYEALVTMFLESRRAKNLSPRTLQIYGHSLGRFLAWGGDRAFTRATVRAYIAELQTRDLSAATINGYVRDLSVFGGFLVEEGIMATNPAARMKPKMPRRRPASYSPDQVRALLNACMRDDLSGLRDRALIVLLLDTGLRVGELIGIDRDSVDFSTGAFSVVGKGNKERVAWMTSYTIDLIREYLATRTDDSPALWVGRRGERLTHSGVHQIIARQAERAGIRDNLRRIVHAFRATFAKNYVKQGGDLETLRRLLGHESIVMSAHYAQLADDELAMHKARINPLAAAMADCAR